MKKFLFITIISILIFVSCGKKQEIKNYTLEPDYIWEEKNIISANKTSCEGMYEDKIFYIQQKPGDLNRNDFVVKIKSLEGDEIKSIVIPQGKGPGEASQILGIKIKNGKIYYGDLALQRVTILDMDGKYIDSFKYNSSKIGFVVYFEIGKENFYFNSLTHVFLGQMNMKTGEVLNLIEQEIKTLPENDSVYEGLRMEYDEKNNNLYVGHMSVPYRIDIYNKNLKKVDQIKHDNILKDTKKMKFYKRMGMGLRIAGKTIITSIALDDNYIYSPYMSSNVKFNKEDFKSSIDNIEPAILITDKKTKEIAGKIKIKGIDEIQGIINILGVTDEYIVISLTNYSEEFNLLKKVYDKDFNNAVMVLKKPEKLK
ncbi:MAG TPA: hypothetical protein VKN74_01820 [Candidatus Mcinerneyibacterium sp.]|nr:hypothetical protein [Candidatus Mcinerneyibacterium sp.]